MMGIQQANHFRVTLERVQLLTMEWDEDLPVVTIDINECMQQLIEALPLMDKIGMNDYYTIRIFWRAVLSHLKSYFPFSMGTPVEIFGEVRKYEWGGRVFKTTRRHPMSFDDDWLPAIYQPAKGNYLAGSSFAFLRYGGLRHRSLREQVMGSFCGQESD